LSKGSSKSAPTYPLKDVVAKIRQGDVKIRADAIKDAFRDFGWGINDILQAIRKLKPKHFIKTTPSLYVPDIMIDSYRATIDKEQVYTHFYIDSTGYLVINSFHSQ
jgi:hypothetical protein